MKQFLLILMIFLAGQFLATGACAQSARDTAQPAIADAYNINNVQDNIILYPNPAQDHLNVLFNPGADIKSISIYNLIGKVVNVFRVTGTSAGLDIGNLPSGVYFIRLTNSQGNTVATRRFTHQ